MVARGSSGGKTTGHIGAVRPGERENGAEVRTLRMIDRLWSSMNLDFVSKTKLESCFGVKLTPLAPASHHRENL